MRSFAEKLAVVTGGGAGMGRELVIQLAAEGCSIAACDLDEESLAETATAATDHATGGARVSMHLCDVTDESSVEAFRDAMIREHSTDHIDLLFNNAGILGGFSFVNGDREAWERTFDICWGGVYTCTRVFLPLLVASDEAVVVNTSSVCGFLAECGVAYSTAKFAVRGFSEALMLDLRANAPHVSVALVMPGVVRTRIVSNSVKSGAVAPADDAARRQLEALDENVFAAAELTSGEAAKTILDGVRAGRWRILVGADAHAKDLATRADPEGVYLARSDT
jgi:NAD(P)-dependent dehydrogenase (short-subunit alcohol dehydrogenase family)